MLIILHLFFMIGAALFFIFGVSIAMFGRTKTFWLKAHKAFNTTGFIILLFGAAMAIANVVGGGGEHFAGLHQQIGFAVVISSFIIVFLGYYSFRAKNKKAVLFTHRWLGRLSLIGVLAALILGLVMIGII